ncbi:TOMM precursor leader peptide-binding protein [Scytonema sp. NUACC26]|uniref:TOMM precursor leader peptide-binding protein n=1 Tax=Scytonema sp. NUACC26 TaxID=3140176 RepID=UPI0034DCC06E
MFYKPMFKSHYHVRVVEPDLVYLLSEKGQCALGGRLYVLLAPFLNGRYTVYEIVQELNQEVSLFEVQNALVRLNSEGYLVDASAIPPQVAAFWNALGVESENALRKLQDSRVSVVSFGKVGVEAFISALESLSIQVGESGEFTVVLTDNYLQLGLDEFNREAEETRKPWLLAKPVGTEIWLGPLFVPGKTGCWECLAQDLRNQRETEIITGQRMSSSLLSSFAVIPVSYELGLNLIALETAKWIIGGEHQQLTGKLVAFNLASLSMQHHVLDKLSECPVCGGSSILGIGD